MYAGVSVFCSSRAAFLTMCAIGSRTKSVPSLMAGVCKTVSMVYCNCRVAIISRMLVLVAQSLHRFGKLCVSVLRKFAQDSLQNVCRELHRALLISSVVLVISAVGPYAQNCSSIQAGPCQADARPAQGSLKVSHQEGGRDLIQRKIHQAVRRSRIFFSIWFRDPALSIRMC